MSAWKKPSRSACVKKTSTALADSFWMSRPASRSRET